MKTDELIAALSADRERTRPLWALLALAIGASTIAAFAMFVMMLGPRQHFMHLAMNSMRFDFKFVFTLTLAITSVIAAVGLMRPGKPSRRRMLLLGLAPALLLVAVAVELYLLPPADWYRFWMGHNAILCMTFIPIFSMLPLGILLFALRSGATTTPARTGAVAGLVAAGLGATFYAAHCFDDSPLFVATWYTISIVIVSGLGAILGSRVLRW